MTTIAYRSGVMASDTKAYLGSGGSGHARKTKIFRLLDNSLVGVSSSIVGASVRLIPWIEDGMNHEAWPIIKGGDREMQFEVLLVRQSGEMLYFNDGYLPTTIEAEFHAIGSGGNYALGAMAAGCTAVGAVEVACRFDNFSGGNVDVWKLNE